MITAKDARKQSVENCNKIAREFITNVVESLIHEAINNAKFSTTVSFDNIPNGDVVGSEVVKLLKENGFSAEHIYYDGPNGYCNYISISWENEE